MQSQDVTINGETYTVEAWDSEVHGFYPMVHDSQGRSVNIGYNGDDADENLTPEQAIEVGRQALHAVIPVSFTDEHGTKWTAS